MATKNKLLVVALAATALAGCANMTETQQRTAVGTGVGAAAGAALGSIFGGSGGATRTGAVLGAAAGGIGTYVWSKRMEDQKRAMEQATQGTGVGVTQTADNQLKLNVPSDVSFDTGRADIKPNLAPVLDRFAQTLQQNPATTVRIIGHTDSTGTDAINDPLSINRAASTRQYLAARGVEAGRIAIDGRGSREPIADNGSAAGRAQNRRVEIYVAESAPR
ncbi:MAG: OmpA family protein [Burkholderiaceae bacterium]|nr:OmpA family protein [Burkholderiaceae bacterium]